MEQYALCADSTNDVHHAIVEVNVVIGVLVVHCELLVVRVVPVVVCDVAVVRRTLVLIALHRRLCFRHSHFSKNFAVLEVYYLHLPSVTGNCCWLLQNFELYFSKLIMSIIPRRSVPITFHQVSLDQSGLGTSSW